MKKRDFEKFARQYLLPSLDGFTVDGTLIYQIPVGSIFRGFIFDSSGFSAEAVHPSVFVQPLWVPATHFTMTLGERLRGSWKFSPPGDGPLASNLLESIHNDGLPFLQSLGTPEKIAHLAEKLKSPKNHYVRQSAAYALVLIGENEAALRSLDKLLMMLKEMGEAQKWALGVHAEVSSLRDTCSVSPDDARQLLAHWTEQTRQNLGLPS